MGVTGGSTRINKRLMGTKVFFFLLLTLFTLVVINLFENVDVFLCVSINLFKNIWLRVRLLILEMVQRAWAVSSFLHKAIVELSKPLSTSLCYLWEERVVGLCSLPLPVIWKQQRGLISMIWVECAQLKVFSRVVCGVCKSSGGDYITQCVLY